MITPSTLSPVLYFLEASSQGLSLRAFIESEILSSFFSITFTFIFVPTEKRSLGSSTNPQSSSDICTSPSRPSSNFTNTPKSTIPVISLSSISPTS